MRVVCAVRGMSACAPLIPLRRTPLPCSKRPKTLAGRAGEQRRVFFQVFRNPPALAKSALSDSSDEFRLSAVTGFPLPLARHSSEKQTEKDVQKGKPILTSW